MFNSYLETPSAGAMEHARVDALACVSGVDVTGASSQWLDYSTELVLQRPETASLTFVPTGARQGTGVSGANSTAVQTATDFGKRIQMFTTRRGQRRTARPG